jgi:phage-related minor tail protein
LLNENVYKLKDAIPSFKDSLGNITDTVYKASEETNAQGATFSENLGKAVGAIGIAATSVMGIAAGIGQIKEGGASNVLGGIGSVLMGIGGAMGGFGKLFPEALVAVAVAVARSQHGTAVFHGNEALQPTGQCFTLPMAALSTAPRLAW